MLLDHKQIKLHILLAEDDVLSRLLLCAILENAGHTYRVAANGREAVEFFRTERFDAVFLALQIPELDGRQTALKIKEIAAYTQKPPFTTALTSNTSFRGKQGRDDVFDEQLGKPVNPEDVLELLEGVAATLKRPSCRRSAAVETSAVWEKTGRDIDFLQSLLQKFMTGSADCLHKLRRAFTEHDGTAVVRFAHILKGQFAVFNADKPMRLAGQLEALGGQKYFTDYEPLLAEIEQEIELLYVKFSAFIAQHYSTRVNER